MLLHTAPRIMLRASFIYRHTSGEADPVCFIQWNQTAIAAATQEGPHVDNNGQPDPKTVDSPEAAVEGAGASQKAMWKCLSL